MSVKSKIDHQSLFQLAWDEMRTEPQKVLYDALHILSEVRNALKEQSTTTNSGALVQLELEALHLLGFAYNTVGNNHKARETAQDLLTLATKHKNNEYGANAELLLAKLYMGEGQYDIARPMFEKLLKVFIKAKHYEYIQAVYIDLSTIEHYHSNYDVCLEYLQKAEIEYKHHPTKGRVEVVILSNMVNVYSRIGNMQKALEYALKNAEVSKQKNFIRDYAGALLQLSNLYAKQGNGTKQANYIREAMDLSEQNNFPDLTAKFRVALAQMYVDTKDFKKAQQQYTLAEYLLLELNDTYSIAIVHMRLMNLFGNKQHPAFNLTKARAYFNKANAYSTEKQNPHFQSAILKEWADILFESGKYKEAFQVQSESTALEKNVLNEKSLEKLKQLEVQYDVLLKEKEKEILATKMKIIEQERDHLQSKLVMNNKSMLIQAEELNKFRLDILGITKELDRAEEIVRKVKLKLREAPLMQSSWEGYLETFKQVHPDFAKNLMTKYPTITKMEVKICTLLRAGMQTETIADVLSLSPRSIENHRLRIRKKLEVHGKMSLVSVLTQL